MRHWNPLAATLVILALAPLVSTVGDNGNGDESSTVDDRLAPYVRTIEERGSDPTAFVLGLLDRVPLVIFDEGLHSSVEPWEFYSSLIRNPDFRKRVDALFVEIFAISHQGAIDDYLSSDPENLSLLEPVFQNDYSGSGWTYQTSLDFLRAIRDVNHALPAKDRLRVVAVSNPVHWSDLREPRDVELMRKALIGRDHLMYRVIVDELDGFHSDLRGVFLTNTRHAYTGVLKQDGGYYWNTGTFFRQWHPEKTASVRVHTIALWVEGRREKEAGDSETTAGMEKIDYRWVRMEEGLWDSAFAATKNRPRGFEIDGTPFGNARYVGNHMFAAAPGQTVADAYDGLIFLAPLEKQELSETFDFIYTDTFRVELERRYRVMHGETGFREMIEKAGFESASEFIANEIAPRPRRPLLESYDPGPIDAWREAPRQP